MNKLRTLFSAALLLGAIPVHAQWITETYTLKGGWNAIQLHGAASGTPDEIFSSGDGLKVTEIWRWNPNPAQVQYTTTPLIPSPGTPEWSVWKRGFPLDSNLSSMNGQTAYLVKCDGPAPVSVPLKLSPLPPGTAWLRTGANLLGFPSSGGGGGNPPLFSRYFATFPAAIAPSTKIYKYVGGEFGALNPMQVLSPSTERLDRHTAYWFDSGVVSNFYAPLEITLSNPNGLDFGKTGSGVTLRVSNRSSAPVTLTFAPVASETAPPGQLTVAGAVPLTRRSFNAITAAWTETALPASSSEVIAPQSAVELNFGINRGLMSSAADTFYASLLRFTDSGNLVDLTLPVRAKSSSLTGLWVGDAQVGIVRNQAKFTAAATASISSGGAVTGLTLKSQGLGYSGSGDATVTIAAPGGGGIRALATATVSQGTVTDLTLTDGGSGYLQKPAVTISSPSNPPGGDGTARPAPLRFIVFIDAGGKAWLLSQVYMGRLASTGEVGLCTREAGLKQDGKAGAARLFAAHLPMDRVLAATGGASAVLGNSLQYTVEIDHDESTNPFVHRFHPDHNNKNPRGEDLKEGVESHKIIRTMTLELTAAPPAGSPAAGWGSSTIGGNYREVISGLSREAMEVSGTFELRRVSELSELTKN